MQTGLAELERALVEDIFRSVTSGISVADASRPDLPLIYVNPAFEAMTGYRLEEVYGSNCRFLQGRETAQTAVSELRAAIAGGQEVQVTLRNFRKDGRPFWNELSLSPIRNARGGVTHYVGIQTDVTMRMEFEAALRESEKLAAVGRLASSIAHEINNPLAAVMNLLYLAQSEQGFEEMRRYVALADREVRRAASITAQSLRFYKQSTLPQAVEPVELLDPVIDLYQHRAENSGVHILRRDRPCAPSVCLESEIRQVLNNLLRNALDAMHGIGGRLQVRTREATDWASGEQGVLFTVADSGVGIHPAAKDQLGTPFFTTKGIAGTGLGLWVASEIIARHGGRLHVRSGTQPGRSGTVFALFLPRRLPLP